LAAACAWTVSEDSKPAQTKSADTGVSVEKKEKRKRKTKRAQVIFECKLYDLRFPKYSSEHA
jgi:hypothetical protein